MPIEYEKVRDWVLDLPGGQEITVAQWGHPTLRVNHKMFASGAPGSPTLTVKCTGEEQAALIAERPNVYSVAAYVGRFGWVEVQLSKVDPAELRELVIEAWRRTAPKRLVKEYDRDV